MGYNHYQQLLQALAKIVCHTQTKQKEFVNNFRFALAHTAKKEFPKHSISELSHITGLPRVTLAQLLNQDSPIKPINRDAILISELWKMRDSYDRVQVKGEFSYYKIAQQILNSAYSPEIALKSFIEMDLVEFCQDNKCITIKASQITIDKNQIDFSQYVGKTLEHIVNNALCDYQIIKHK
jgi:hypothetical protein